MIDARIYQEGDESLIDARDSNYNYEMIALSSYVYTITKDDRPVTIFGCFYISEGVYYIWTIMSEDVRGHGIFLTKFASEILKQVAMREDVKVFKCTIDSAFPENIRWAGMLGFKPRGIFYAKEIRS